MIETKTKFSGADNIVYLLESRGRVVSPFGVKVANILGQVYRGIYHIPQRHLLHDRTEWHSEKSICIRVDNELATADGDELTRLVLCCEKAEVICGIRGIPFGGTMIMFTPRSQFIGFSNLKKERRQNADVYSQLDEFVAIKKELQRYPDFYFAATENLGWLKVCALVEAAHRCAVRVSIRGRSMYSLEIGLHKRNRDAKEFSRRHLSLEAACKKLQPYVDVDYSTTETN